ncbi:MAG: FecR domain-containing protein [Ignavibacteria bacterium]|nr:FecR domain-containing protein [Ignavibacteria bacterium]
MNRNIVVVVLILASLVLAVSSSAIAQERRDIQAIIVKVVRDVDKSTQTGWERAIPLDRLRSGQEVRTDDKSVALIRFADETKLIVREKSIVEIKGQVQGKEILSREVHTTRGNIAFNVKKSEKEQFRFTSPISVASIRGTEGTYVAESDSLNMLIINRGSASFTNLISNQSMDVGSGQIGIADNKGNLDVRNATPKELEDSGKDDSTQPQPPPKVKKVLRIPGEDKDGNPKTIVIEWEKGS